MSDAELLQKVKSALPVTGNFHDDLLTIYINEVQNFLRDGGVNNITLASPAALGVIVRGVSDMWLGNGELSPYFMQRAAQLKYVVI